jgi:putative oxidoreductase
MSRDDVGRLLLRLAVGGLLLLHGLQKLRHGIGGIADQLAAHGVPSFVAYGVFVGEVVAPVALLLGWLTRIAAGIVAFNMVVAVLVAHTGDLLRTGRGGGYALELQALYLAGALGVALLGSGRYAIRPD